MRFGYGLVEADNFDGVFGTQAYFISKEKAINLSEVIVPIKTIADDWKLFLERGYFSDIKIVYPFPVLHAELLSVVNENNSKRNLRTRLKYFMYCNKVFPFYTLFLWRRRNRAEKMQKKYINAPEFLKMKTYKL